MKPIPYARQTITEADIQAVVAVLRSDFLTQGPAIELFEKAVASYCGARHTVAVANATGALHLACLALGLGKGDLLWTSPNTFVASANCALYTGANVDFVDIDPVSYNLSVKALEEKLVAAEKKGRLPKVVIPVHFAGQSCEMDRISALGKRYGFKIIEDASHAIGGSYRDEKIGNCRFSDITVFSFHPVKIITSAEGGMLATNDAGLQQKLLRLRSHGITRDPSLMTRESDGPWYMQQLDLGYNYRMTDMQAALGEQQLRRVNEFIVRRHELAKRYDAGLRALPVTLPAQSPGTHSALHLYPIHIDKKRTGKSRRQVFEELVARGILVNVHYIPVHLQPYYEKLGFKQGQFPAAEHYYDGAISLPMYYGLSDNDQDRVIQSLTEVL